MLSNQVCTLDLTQSQLVSDFAVSDYSQFLAVCIEDGKLLIYYEYNKRLACSYELPDIVILAAEFAPIKYGYVIALACSDLTVKLLQMKSLDYFELLYVSSVFSGLPRIITFYESTLTDVNKANQDTTVLTLAIGCTNGVMSVILMPINAAWNTFTLDIPNGQIMAIHPLNGCKELGKQLNDYFYIVTLNTGALVLVKCNLQDGLSVVDFRSSHSTVIISTSVSDNKIIATLDKKGSIGIWTVSQGKIMLSKFLSETAVGASAIQWSFDNNAVYVIRKQKELLKITTTSFFE